MSVQRERPEVLSSPPKKADQLELKNWGKKISQIFDGEHVNGANLLIAWHSYNEPVNIMVLTRHIAGSDAESVNSIELVNVPYKATGIALHPEFIWTDTGEVKYLERRYKVDDKTGQRTLISETEVANHHNIGQIGPLLQAFAFAKVQNQLGLSFQKAPEN